MSTTSESEDWSEDDPRRKLSSERFAELREQARKTKAKHEELYPDPGQEMPDEAIDESWGFTPDMSAEERRALIAQYAEEDEIEEDPELARRTSLELAALKDEQLLVHELSTRSLTTTLPRAVRQLFRENTNSPSIRRLYDKLAEELFERTDEKLRSGLLDAVDTMLEVMRDGDDAQRLRAATYVFERMRGKTPDVVEISQSKPFQVVLERVVSGPRRKRVDAARAPAEDGEVQDAELVEEDDEWEEERSLMEEWDAR